MPKSTELYLSDKWQKLTAGCFESDMVAENMFLALCRKYNQKHRYYHNLSHIENLYRLFEQYSGQMDDSVAVEWAIWFHDAIYQPQSQNNERRSAELLIKWLSSATLPEKTIAKAYQLILATKTHSPEGLDYDGLLFLDMDMAVLGQPDYAAYREAIRMEAKAIPDLIYRVSRIKILTDFLSRPRIYHTSGFFEQFETLARQNMTQEIKDLENQTVNKPPNI